MRLPAGGGTLRRMAFSAGAQPVGPGAEPGHDGWEARALQRSLATARARSIDRSHRIVAAARELADETGSAGFTMAQVGARAGVSLKTVYRCFEGKDDLLLALLEEESRVGAEILAQRIEAQPEPSDPLARLRAFIDGIFELLTFPGREGYAGVLAREHHRLETSRADDLRTALAPLAELLGRELRAATAAGRLDPGDPERATDTVFTLVLSGISQVTRGRAEAADTAAWVWRFCTSGLQAKGP